MTVEAGYRTVSVYMINAKGSSSPTWPNATFWAGPGVPSTPQNVALVSEGDNVTLTWNAVTTPTNTIAFFVPEEVTYKVVRTPDNVVVGENLTATTLSTTLPDVTEPTGFRFNVYAQFRGQESAAAPSTGIAKGTATPAWNCQLNSINNFDLFKIINANGDNVTWNMPSYATSPVIAKGASGKDDWLVTPGLNMTAGTLYPVSIRVASYNSNYTETFEVKGGMEPTVEGMTVEAIPATEVATADHTAGTTIKGWYLAPADGVNYLGIHAMTPTATYDAYVMEINVGDGIAAAAPESVENLTVTSDFDVLPPTAVLTFTTPVKAIDGSNLTSLSAVEIRRDGELVATVPNPGVGEQVTVSDVVPEKGTYTYTVAAVNAAGAGRVTEQSIFVGDYRIHPPYSCDFTDKDEWEKFTVLNNNGDSYAWTQDQSSGYASCNSSSSANGDDWLILPAIWLNAGFRYTFTVEVKSYWNGDPVAFEVMTGRDNTPEALTDKIGELPAADANIGTTWRTYTYNVDVDESDEYFFAIHYIQKGNMCRLCVNKVEVGEGLNVGAPQAITDLTAVPDFGGELKTEISFTAPSQSMAQTDLTSNLSKIEVARDGEIIRTFTDVAPGQAITFTDENPEAGYRVYAVTPYAATKGETSQVRVYVGANIPEGPTGATLEETAPGTVKITWTAPELDVDGETLNPALVTYRVERMSIYGEEPATVAEGISATEYTCSPVEEGEQRFVGYRVKAETAGGVSSTYSDTEFIPVGTPYSMPFSDSFAEGTMAYEYLAERIGDYPSEWRVYSNRDLSNLEDQDGNNGVIGMYAPYTTGQSRLVTGKINVDGTSPDFSIWVRSVPECQCKVTLEVREVGDAEFTDLGQHPAWDSNVRSDWAKISASLADYVGKTVQIAVNAYMTNHNYLFFDNLRLTEAYDVNLTVNAISAPARMYPEEDATVNVTLQNNTSNLMEAGSYSVDLYRNNEKVQTYTGQLLQPDQTITIPFVERHSLDCAETGFTYHAVAVAEGDGYLNDNTSDQVEVAFFANGLPAVSDLTAISSGGANTLTWSAPQVPAETTTEPVTEDFENYPSFAKADLDDWLLVDADGEKFVGFNGISLPGISGSFSYFILDSAFEELGYDPYETLKAHSGSKYAVSAATEGPSMASDDWLISPQVSNGSHDLKFFAKSYDSNYKETFEVLYSLQGRDIADFKRIRVYSDVPASWTEYNVTLPEGTRYFAIRCMSVDKFMFFLDDITFTPMNVATEALVIKGYNIYRDGELLNNKPVTETHYADATAPANQKAIYTVRTIYAQGDSPMSNPAEIMTSGVGMAFSGRGINVYGGEGMVVVEDAEGDTVIVSTPDGKVLARAEARAPRTLIPTPAGVVLVTVGNTTAKIWVR